VKAGRDANVPSGTPPGSGPAAAPADAPLSGRFSARVRKRLTAQVVATVLAVAIALSLLQLPFDGLLAAAFDFAARVNVLRDRDLPMALVPYDDASSRRFGDPDRIPLTPLLETVHRVAAQKPAAILVLGAIDDRAYRNEELEAMARGLEEYPNTYVGFTDDGALGRSIPGMNVLAGRYLPAIVSKDTYSYGADSVTRRVFLAIEGFPTAYGAIACGGLRSLSRWNQCLEDNRATARGASWQTFIDWRDTRRSTTRYSLADVVDGVVPSDAFRDRYVIIGRALSVPRDRDFVLTPLEKGRPSTSVLEAAAQGLGTLVDRSGLGSAPAYVVWILTLLFSLITTHVALTATPQRATGLAALGFVVLLVGAVVASFAFRRWVDVVHPALAIVVGYYFVLPYRLFDEYQKRWHYQEKSEFMAELEELKSNFLSLISHDLKTPIARIQGAAERLLAEKAPPERVEKTLKSVVRTTEELTEYIESILDLARVESGALPLHLASKDLNKTVEKVLEEKAPMAHEKHIGIDVDLEPLFAATYDEKLIRRVVANLLENAIKYSPPETKIRIATREEDGRLRLEVKDQGRGIAPDEQERVFEKFYRSRSANTEQVRGAGLGLYLVRYFVELHGGSVTLESEPGRGSTFTVSLPT
jgi:signal transduction histidine kinase